MGVQIHMIHQRLIVLRTCLSLLFLLSSPLLLGCHSSTPTLLSCDGRTDPTLTQIYSELGCGGLPFLPAILIHPYPSGSATTAHFQPPHLLFLKSRASSSSLTTVTCLEQHVVVRGCFVLNQHLLRSFWDPLPTPLPWSPLVYRS